MRDIWISVIDRMPGYDAVVLGSVGPVPGDPGSIEKVSRRNTRQIRRRAGEQARAFPGKEALFAAYVRAQEEACACLENDVVCAAWILKKSGQERSIHEIR